MANVHHLSRQDARRVAIRAQLLTGERPTDLLEAVRRLTFLQLDPVSAVAPAADLVLWTRLGQAYHPDHLKAVLADRQLIELQAFLRPAEHVALYRAEMAAWPADAPGAPLKDWQVFLGEWVAANDRCRRDILDRLRAKGPLQSRELPDACDKPWESTGWTNNKNVTKLLGFMTQRGEVAVAGRKGRERLWDVAERVYPDDPVIPAEQAVLERDRRRLAALGIARVAGPSVPVEPAVVGQAGEPATVEGVRGEWRLDPAYLDGAFEGRAALLSPFDRLAHNRVRAEEIFEFEYQLEMYKPAASRRWGYYALPILYGDRLVGKLDATADRKTGLLTVNAIHQDVPFSADMSAAIDAEITSLARWLSLDVRKVAKLPGSRGDEQVAGDRGGGHHVQRVHSSVAGGGIHRDPDPFVGLVQPAGGKPVALGAEQQRDPIGARLSTGESGTDGGHALVGGEREHPEAGRLQVGETVKPAGHPGVPDGEHRAHRHLHRPAVKRVSTARREHHRIHAERGGAAKDRADVGVVDQVLQDDDAPGVGDHLGDRGQRPAGERRERAPVDAVAGHFLGDPVRDHINRHAGSGKDAQGLKVDQAAAGEQHRADRVASGGGTGDNFRSLRDEQAMFGLQVRPQPGVRQPRVIRQPGVVGAADLDGTQHAPSLVPWAGERHGVAAVSSVRSVSS